MKFITLLTFIIISVLLSGCITQSADANTAKDNQIIYMPKGFGDVAFKCDGQNMVYVTKDDVKATSAIYVVANDERCLE